MFGFGKKDEKAEMEQSSPDCTTVGLPNSPPDTVEGVMPAKKQNGTFHDTESVISDVTLVAQQEGLKPTFVAKVNVINRALAEIGMGKYQWEMFLAGGFGWFADNIWLQGVAIVQPQVSYEWNRPVGQTPNIKYTTLALYAGLIVGASFWGCSADIIGRRTAWNATLFVGAVFGVAAGGANNFITFCSLLACIGFGVGGNLPVDGTMFLEFLPGTHQYLLTLLSVWWAIGQVVASLIAWGFLARWNCDHAVADPEYICHASENMGWRYTYYTLGAMMFVLWIGRFFILPVYESPKFLISHGRDQAAVDVINAVAKRNKHPLRISVEDLHRAVAPFLTEDEKMNAQYETKLSTMELIKSGLSEFNTSHIKTLFATKRLAISTSLIVFCYGAVGIAYPLFFSFLGTYLDKKLGAAGSGGTDINSLYRAYTYQAVCGVPGSFAAAYLVTWSRGGRKFAMAFFTAMTGVFLFCLTASKNNVTTQALTCMASFFANAFYGVMYGYAPELFPTPARGTGDALCAAFNRITGIFAPVIAIVAPSLKQNPDGPVMASGGIFVATGIIMLFLPVETNGRTAL
ncbi:hypothetical protein CspHIS471_0503080 [Cutaneotrichosporon sp. HIS471]|nr:hypothetical protein CspHIS471_0503080 [Cutaneotrichosporon sp. HIS471]